MDKIFSIVGNVLMWGALIVVVASVGFLTDKPALMVPLYGVTFALVLAGLVFFLKRQKRKTFEQLKTPVWVPSLYCGILAVLTIVFPHMSLGMFRPGEFNVGLIYLFTFILLGLGFAGVWMINILSMKNKLFRVAGFVVLILTSLIPALLVAPIDSSYGTLGVTYFTMAVEAMIAWGAFAMIHRHFIVKE